MKELATYLADHRFAELFREELGWDRCAGSLATTVDDRRLVFDVIAHKRGLQVLQCAAHRQILLNRGLLRRAQRAIESRFHEHIVIWCCDHPPKQVWQWALRMDDGRRLRHREHPFFSATPPPAFLARLVGLRCSLEEEADVSIIDALRRVRAALDVSAEQNLFARWPKFAERSDELAVAMSNGEPGAFDEFVLLHRPLARHYSKWLQHAYRMDAEEAEQIAMIGVMIAARRFNPERGLQFSTYACYWIRQVCQRVGPDTALLIRLPAHIVQRFFPLRRRLGRVRLQFGPARANEELESRYLNNERFYRQWLGFERAVAVRSLSDRRECEYRQARRLSQDTPTPADECLSHERDQIVRAAVEQLQPRDARFVRLRYGMDGLPQTLEEIGRADGITRERVRQILERAEGRLRALLHKHA
ncbi:MAG TPA: sigma-70 family RNA polymerase sigma factor [Pirellulales bacterium]|nr:sigma-70 family RNA polymerase sigma factor [Pirellulales bacterium]